MKYYLFNYVLWMGLLIFILRQTDLASKKSYINLSDVLC